MNSVIIQIIVLPFLFARPNHPVPFPLLPYLLDMRGS